MSISSNFLFTECEDIPYSCIVDIGCGGYADNRSGASSTTGHGEAFMRTCLAKHIAVLMEQGCTVLCLYF